MKKGESQVKIGIILNYINMIIGNLIPVFYTPIMLNLLGQNEYGLYKLSSSVTSYLSLISMGVGSAITRYLIKAKVEGGAEAEKKMFGLFSVVFKLISLIAVLIGIILVLNVNSFYDQSLDGYELRHMKILMMIMVANMSISFCFSPYISVVSAHEKFLFAQCMNILITTICPVINIIILYCGYGSIGIAVVTLIVEVTCRFIYLIYVSTSLKIKPSYTGMPSFLLKEIFTFSFWVFLANVAGQLYNATDVILIGTLPQIATAGVAVYSIGATFNNIVGSITTGVSAVLTPKANRMVFENVSSAMITEFASRVGRIQGLLSGLMVSGFIVFGKPFISFYAGKGYEDAYWVAILMMVPMAIPLLQTYCLSVLIAENKHKFRSIMYLFIAVFNVIGTWFAMQRHGIIGAAAVTGIATVIGNGFLMNWYYGKRTTIDIKTFWRKVLPIFKVPLSMGGVCVCICSKINYTNIFILLIAIVLYSLIYVLLSYIFTMNKYEKSLLHFFRL